MHSVWGQRIAMVYEWIEMFKNGRTSVMDAERSTSTTDEKLEEARPIILTDR